MINITLPDGAVRQYESGVTALDIARSISEGLARKVLAAKVNGEVWDATRPITGDATLKLVTWDDSEGKSTFWHSSAHLMAEAVESMFPGVKFWVGPPLDNGFYYDMDLGDRKMSDTITVYHNNEVVAFKRGLSNKPITINIKASVDDPHHEFVMVADNLGSIPPNTALMVVTTGGKRYEVFISSDEQKNAKVIIDYKVPETSSR